MGILEKRVGEPLSPGAAVEHIISQTGDPTRFKVRARGFIDWKFGELCEYLGYTEALRYTTAALRWFDRRAVGSLLEQTYLAFLEAYGITITNTHHSPCQK